MSATIHEVRAKDAEREALQAQVAAYIKAGGTIKVAPPNEYQRERADISAGRRVEGVANVRQP